MIRRSSTWSLHPDFRDVQEIPHEILCQANAELTAELMAEGFTGYDAEPGVAEIDRRAAKLMEETK